MHSQAPIVRRIAAYLVVLIGYLFYCYNFNVTDYVRPYLLSDYHFTLTQAANLAIPQTVGITLGAFCWAAFVARVGKRRAIGAIAAAIGGLAAIQAAVTVYPAWFGVRGLMAAALGGYYVVATGIVVAMFPVWIRGRLIALNSAMYPLSNILLGLLGGQLGDARWHLLMWLGAIPLLIAPLAMVMLPSDLPEPEPTVRTQEEPGGWREMLSGRLRWVTIGCIVLSGIDFNAYQLFASFVTVYLKQSLSYDAGAVGGTVAVLGAGSLAGGFAWAWLSDRFGRKSPAVGYLISAAAIFVFLEVPIDSVLEASALVFGIGLSCTSAWGVWFTELYPERLRPYGAALFHAGHVIAMAAPIYIAYATPSLGLRGVMLSGSAVYILGAGIWLALPETLKRETREEETTEGPA